MTPALFSGDRIGEIINLDREGTQPVGLLGLKSLART